MKRLPIITEDGLQKQIIQALRLFGYLVLVTTHRIKKCPCGRWSRVSYGSSKGVPDLLVTRTSWDGFWLALEVKRPAPGRARLSPEQQELASLGAVAVVRSLDEALAAVGPPDAPGSLQTSDLASDGPEISPRHSNAAEAIVQATRLAAPELELTKPPAAEPAFVRAEEVLVSMANTAIRQR
jgi:hypothetical protein